MADSMGDGRAAIVDRGAGQGGGALQRLARRKVAAVGDGPFEIGGDETDRLMGEEVVRRAGIAVGGGLEGVDERVDAGRGGEPGRQRARVVSGSRMTSSAFISSPHSQTLALSARVRMAVRVSSEPVPEVVGMTIEARRFAGKGLLHSS